VSTEDVCQIAQFFFEERIESIKYIDGGYEVSFGSNFHNPLNQLKIKLFIALSSDGTIILKFEPIISV